SVSIAEEGRTEVRDRYVVAAPVTGRVGRMRLEAGDEVRAGETVACVAPQPLDPRARDEARARLDAGTDLHAASRAAVEEARAAVAQARRDRERVERLERERAVSAQQSEQARLAEETANRQLEGASARERALEHQVEEARAALRAAEPASGVGCFDVHAPSAGRVLRVVQRSERVVLAGAPIVELGDPARLDVVAELLSEDAVRVHAGDTMLVDNWGGEGTLRATIRLVEPSGFTKVSALGVEEQRVRVLGAFTNAPPALGDGYRVDVRIVLWRGADVLQVPATSLFRRNGAWQVFALENGRARLTPVTPGREGGGRTEIVAGLEPGMRVVRHPSDRLRDGVRATAVRTE
ncbi:MAG: efflux RND transporter periplasmic adaptor subunit, partial [Gemmatimonadales bacterium]|nr:efflux RND transporter periplasmic adaptor subunit [Gemmatimonadales bacterium]